LNVAPVLAGDRGDYVRLIQGALQMLDYALIDPQELIRQQYGDSTASAVFRYKNRRNISDLPNRTRPGDLVDQGTMQSIDNDVFSLETRYNHFLLAFGVPAQPTGTVVAQSQPYPNAWASQFVSANQGNPGKWSKAPSPGGTPKQAVEGLQKIIRDTGERGVVIFACGHGIPPGLRQAGAFDLAEHGLLRVGDKGTYNDLKIFVDVYYDTVDPGTHHSPREDDLATQAAGAKRRLENWALWQSLCNTFKDTHLSLVILLTCNIGKDPAFLKKVAGLWGAPILAYKDFISYEGAVPGQQRARAVLDRDAGTQSGTDTPFAETHIPMSQQDIVVITP
jgi:hypothetical protein